MERYLRKDEDDDGRPQLLNFMSKESRKCFVKTKDETSSHGVKNNPDDHKKLELSLGPPGGDWAINDSDGLSSGCFSNTTNSITKFSWAASCSLYEQTGSIPTESSQPCCNSKVVVELQQSSDKKAFSPAVPNSAQKRTAPAPVVGWPPIRSFRKNLASSCSSLKPASESLDAVPHKATGNKPTTGNGNCSQKGLFVKINMDSIPIGRKVDLNSYDSYEKLCYAVDELFRGLLAAQSDSWQNKDGREKPIAGLLDGSGEYTLVYEDNEGDRMLAGDVPWHMFVSTVKRLRVLKSSDLPVLCRGNKRGKPPLYS